MAAKSNYPLPQITLLIFIFIINNVQAQPSTIGYNCTANQSTSSCETYVFYRSTAPNYLDLASIGDLFSVSRPMIANPSDISSPSSPLLPDQSLFIPITCSCNTVNSSITISYSGLNYTIKSGDTFYLVSNQNYQNLTTYQSVEVVNPSIEPTRIHVGDVVVFPIFCKCPDSSQLRNSFNYLISYVFQPFDSLNSIAYQFGSTFESITEANGGDIQPFDTVFVPVSSLPTLTQPILPPSCAVKRGAVIGLGICVMMLILL